MSSREKAISFIVNLRSCYWQSYFLSFSFLFFFFNDGTTGIGEENCASLHVSKNRANFQVSWTWTHSVKLPAIKRWSATVQSQKMKKKGSSRRIYSCFFTHNGVTTPKTTREGQESTTKTSLHLAWPPKFKNQVLFTPRAQNRFLDLGLLLRGCRPKSRSLPRRVEVIHPVVRACTTFWLTSTRITLTRVHRRRKLVIIYHTTDIVWSFHCQMGPVRIRHSSHDFGWQSSHSVDLAGWQAKMASIEIWIPWRNAHKPHCWVPCDGYIRHQNDHLSGRMTDISVMGEWQVAGVGGFRPLEKVLGEALEGRFSLEVRNYLFSFQRCPFRRVFCFPRFWKIWRQTFKLCGFCFGRSLGGLLENSAPSPGIFLRTPTTTTSNFWKFSFFLPKKCRCCLPDSYGDPQAEQSTLVMVRQKLEWNLDLRPALARSSAEGPSIVVAIGTSRVRWSIVQRGKKKHKEASVWLREVSTLHHLQTSEFWGACFRDPMSLPFCTSLLYSTWMYSCWTVRLQCGESEEKQSSVTFPVLITEA